MKIALIGYGRMGHAIERIALERGHEIVAIVNIDSDTAIDSDEFRRADVAIEFSIPSAAPANVRDALAQGVPVVSGTTGWADRLQEVRSAMPDGGAFMTGFPQYVPDMTETHHIHKLDHPSGTALMAAGQIIDAHAGINGWSEEPAGPDKLLINHIRHGEVPGIHKITWESDIDSITLEHSAKSRDGFALGAVMAAEWLPSHPGFHSIDDMMNDIIHGNK